MCNGSVSRGLFFFLSFLLSRWHNDWKFLHTSASGMTRENAATKQFNPRRILTCRERERDWVTGRKLAWQQQQQQQPTTTTRADNASLSLSRQKQKTFHCIFSIEISIPLRPSSDWKPSRKTAFCWSSRGQLRECLVTLVRTRLVHTTFKTVEATLFILSIRKVFHAFIRSDFCDFFIKEKMHNILLDKKVWPQQRGKSYRHFCFFSPFWRRVSNSFSGVRFGRNRRRRRTQIIRFCQITRENQKEKMSKGKINQRERKEKGEKKTRRQ